MSLGGIPTGAGNAANFFYSVIKKKKKNMAKQQTYVTELVVWVSLVQVCRK
jgi:hypothetical protein